ncbi:MAG: hypothetical protein IPI28_18960 [Candidatus Omnitrophica bacterium]|nr:hypothetical protein [Candidatus Omnitrophota bacterium]
MAGTSSTNIQGDFKEAYASKIENLIPQCAYIQQEVPFVPRQQRTGNLYHLPVILSSSQGFTYGAVSAGAMTLNNAVSMNMGDAQIQGVQLCLQNTISFEAVAKSKENSFESATKLVIDDSSESQRKRLELMFLYGQSTTGLGLATQASQVASSSTVTTYIVTEGQWSAGIWSGLENAQVNFYYSTSTLVSSGADAIFTITSVDPDTRTLTITGTTTGSSALVTAINGQSTVRPYFVGAFGVEAAGLQKILSNTGSLFNIDAASYSLWRSNVITITGALNYGRIQQAVAKCTVRGLDEDVTVLVNPMVYIDVSNQITALRRFTSAEDNKSGKMGTGETLNFYGPQGAMVKVVPHLFVKQGDAFVVPMKRVLRVGSLDMSFSLLGNDSDQDFLYPIPGTSAYFFYLYSLQAIIVMTPARCAYISGFLPTTN